MRITQWGEYGIHFSAFLARREREGASTTGAAEIAKSQGIELQYAQQILQRLRRGGIVDSVRGPSGGYHLCRPANTITLGDVLVATEGETFEVICDAKPLSGDRCDPESPCGLRSLWHELKDHVDEFLKRYTVEELSRMPAYTFAETSPHSKDHRHHQQSGDESAPIQIGGKIAGHRSNAQ